VSIRDRIDRRRRIWAAADARRRAVEAEVRALLKREGVVDLIERTNRERYNAETPERSVTFTTTGPPRHRYYSAPPVGKPASDPIMDTIGRPSATVERAF
jgi:hypothetical protein